MADARPAAAKKPEQEPPAGFAPELFESFGAIRSLARTINCTFEVPEVVFVGKRGSGKSTVIESFFGHKLLDPVPTLRPVEIRMVNNPASEAPSTTLLRDSAIEKYADVDVDIPLATIPEALKERNIQTAVPSRVVYQSKWCWDMTIIDTPGLITAPKTDDEAKEAEAIEGIVLNLIRPTSRLLVSVEEVAEWELCESIDFVNRVDPRHDRSFFVFNKFLPFIKNFSSAPELASYLRGGTQLPLLQGACVCERVFFTTSPGEGGRADKPLLYKRRLASLVKTDLDALEALQYDRRFERNIGHVALQRAILQATWRKYQDDVVPSVIRRLRELRKGAVEKKVAAERKLAALTPCDLRRAASLHTSAFLGTIAGMLSGSLEGRPALNGQTLAEERAAAIEDLQWGETRQEFHPLPAKSSIPGADSRLYGAQQFERLCSEFRAIVEMSVQLEVTPDEIATALGACKADVAPDVAWAASDIAASKSRSALSPLVVQLVERAKYVLRYLVTVVDRLAGHGWADTGDDSCAVKIESYPHFTSRVKDLYSTLIDGLARKTLERCSLEFYGPRLVHWELGTMQPALMEKAKDPSIPAQDAVRALARGIFDGIKQRVMSNVLLAVYDGMLVAMQAKMMSFVQGRLAVLSDSEIDELFEAKATKARITSDITYWEQIVAEFQAQDADFLKAASSFGHPGH